MRIGLFVCYIDTLFPEVCVATFGLLEKTGMLVEYPFNQTCCGQLNSGCLRKSAATETLFERNLSGIDYIVVAPSGTCVHQVRYNLDAIPQTLKVKRVREPTFELVEFLTTSSRSTLSLGLPTFDAERNLAAETVDMPAEIQKLAEG